MATIKHGQSFQMRDKLKRIKCCMTILLSLEILAGIILLCITAYYHEILLVFLPKTERQTLLSQFSNIYLLGFEVLICFSIGFILWKFICSKDTISKQSKLLMLWNGFCTLVIVCGSVTMWFQNSNIQSFDVAYSEILYQGINFYFSDPEWKLLWDRIQFNNECCGVFGFEDWEEAAWMPGKEENSCESMSEKSDLMVMIPYACCKHSVTSCFEKFAPRSIKDERANPNANDIHTNGCLPTFKSLLLQFLYLVTWIWLISCITQVLILSFTFYMVSKTKRINFHSFNCSEESDKQPLVVVRYPRNVRCITVTDDHNYDELEEQEEDQEFNRRCQNCQTVCASTCHEFFDKCDPKQNIFVH